MTKRRPNQEKPPHHHGGLFSLRFQIVAILLLCYIIPTVVLGFFAQHILLGRVQKNVESALVNDARYAWNTTLQNLNRIVALGQEAVYDEELANAWNQWRSSAISNAEYLRLSRNYLERQFGRDRLFTFAAFVPAESGGLLISNPSGQTAASAFLRENGDLVSRAAESLDTRSLFTGSGDRMVFIRNVLNLRMENTGTLVLGLDRNEVLSPLITLQSGWKANMRLLVGDYGDQETDWASLPEGFSDLPRENLLRYVQSETGDDYSLYLLLTLNRAEQYRELYSFRNLILLLYLLLIPLLLLIVLFVRRRITRPIGLLADASRRIEAGELGVTVPMRGGDELGDLGVAFSNMSVRLQELIEKTYRGEIELKNAQIQALQSRINPHFLNNALETINWEARIEGSETIENMVSALSVLLNATLGRKNRRVVTLREELEVAEGYIFFIQQRFGDSLTITRDIDPDAETCVVPLLTVQPVLENAVEHGIAPEGGGTVRISVRFFRAMCPGDPAAAPPSADDSAGGCLRLQIANTGRSLTAEDRARIDAALSGDSGESNHLGLANIASRLRLLFGPRAVLTVTGGPDEETLVEIMIPQPEEFSVDPEGQVRSESPGCKHLLSEGGLGGDRKAPQGKEDITS